jgi:hypothetical protein
LGKGGNPLVLTLEIAHPIDDWTRSRLASDASCGGCVVICEDRGGTDLERERADPIEVGTA